MFPCLLISAEWNGKLHKIEQRTLRWPSQLLGNGSVYSSVYMAALAPGALELIQTVFCRRTRWTAFSNLPLLCFSIRKSWDKKSLRSTLVSIPGHQDSCDLPPTVLLASILFFSWCMSTNLHDVLSACDLKLPSEGSTPQRREMLGVVRQESGWASEHHHRSRGRGDGVEGLRRGNWEGG